MRELAGEVPIFGICLGHQILGLALGGKTTSSSSATTAATSRCQDLATGKVAITRQNHGFAVDADSLRRPASRSRSRT